MYNKICDKYRENIFLNNLNKNEFIMKEKKELELMVGDHMSVALDENHLDGHRKDFLECERCLSECIPHMKVLIEKWRSNTESFDGVDDMIFEYICKIFNLLNQLQPFAEYCYVIKPNIVECS